MRTLRHYLYLQIAAASALVLLLFLGLLFFLDVVNGLSDNSAFATVLLRVALELPSRAYEVLPIALLTGSVHVLARLAASSEFTVMRMSGLSPQRALRELLGLGLLGALLVFSLGEFAAPAASRMAATLQARAQGGQFGTTLRSGVWLRDRGTDNVIINVGGVGAGGRLHDVHIYVLGSAARLQRVVSAHSASYDGGGRWALHDATSVELPAAGTSAALRPQHLAQLDWPTSLTPDMIDVLLLDPQHMPVLDLWRYVQHLKANGQAVQRDEIELWRKLLYPFSAIVMMLLALPFGYLHTRGGQVSWKVFGGIMLGISFVLVNPLASRIGLLASWPTWLTAALPYALYAGGALGFFLWRVRYR